VNNESRSKSQMGQAANRILQSILKNDLARLSVDIQPRVPRSSYLSIAGRKSAPLNKAVSVLELPSARSLRSNSARAQNSLTRAQKGHRIPVSTVLQGLIWRLSPCIVIRLADCRGGILGLELDRSPHFSMSYAVVINQKGTKWAQKRHKIVMPQTAFQTVKARYRRLVLCNNTNPS
jgi:hypothetical protein